MKSSDFSSVASLMEEIGKQLLLWRTDPAIRLVNSEANFKTEGDRRAHELMCSGLLQLFPGVEVISEESDIHSNVRPNSYWLIDPIDGTASWYHGYDGFVTQAAYIEQGIPCFGIIHAPALKKTWSAIQNGGAYLNGVRLPTLVANERLIITDNTPTPHGVSKQIMDFLPATDYLESGSIGLKSVLIADGTADLFVKDVCVRDWDLAPAAVILREVGGQICLANGFPYIFDGIFEKTDGFIVARDAKLMSDAITAFIKIKQAYCNNLNIRQYE